MTDNLNAARLLAQYRGELRRICKFVFSKGDASIYVVAYAATDRYLFGSP
jgi:hypothetical protein